MIKIWKDNGNNRNNNNNETIKAIMEWIIMVIKWKNEIDTNKVTTKCVKGFIYIIINTIILI